MQREHHGQQRAGGVGGARLPHLPTRTPDHPTRALPSRHTHISRTSAPCVPPTRHMHEIQVSSFVRSVSAHMIMYTPGLVSGSLRE